MNNFFFFQGKDTDLGTPPPYAYGPLGFGSQLRPRGCVLPGSDTSQRARER